MRRLLGATVALALTVVLVAGCGGNAFPTGKWAGSAGELPYVLEFRSDGTWIIRWRGPDNEELSNEGTYTTDKDTFAFVTDALCKELGFAEGGTYTWRHANDELTLTRQEDECTNRIDAISGEVLTPAK